MPRRRNSLEDGDAILLLSPVLFLMVGFLLGGPLLPIWQSDLDALCIPWAAFAVVFWALYDEI